MCNECLPLVYQLVGLGHHHADPARGLTMTPVRWNSPKGPPSYGPTILPPGQSSKGLPTEPSPAPADHQLIRGGALPTCQKPGSFIAALSVHIAHLIIGNSNFLFGDLNL